MNKKSYFKYKLAAVISHFAKYFQFSVKLDN